MINLLGAEATSRDHMKAGDSFYNAIDLRVNRVWFLPIRTPVEEKAATFETVDFYRKATLHYSQYIQMEQLSHSDVMKKFKHNFIGCMRRDEKFLRERGYQEAADQVATFIPDMMSKCQDSPHETAPAMPAGSFEIVQ